VSCFDVDVFDVIGRSDIDVFNNTDLCGIGVFGVIGLCCVDVFGVIGLCCVDVFGVLAFACCLTSTNVSSLKMSDKDCKDSSVLGMSVQVPTNVQHNNINKKHYSFNNIYNHVYIYH